MLHWLECSHRSSSTFWTSTYSCITNRNKSLVLQPELYQSTVDPDRQILFLSSNLLRTCKLRTEPIALVNRTRCGCCVFARSTAWRRKSWPLPSTNSMWTRKSSRPGCLTRSLPATSVGPSCRPSWNTRSKTRSGVRKCVYAWMCVRAPATHNFRSVLSYALLANVCLLYLGRGRGPGRRDSQSDDCQKWGGVWPVHGQWFGDGLGLVQVLTCSANAATPHHLCIDSFSSSAYGPWPPSWRGT